MGTIQNTNLLIMVKSVIFQRYAVSQDGRGSSIFAGALNHSLCLLPFLCTFHPLYLSSLQAVFSCPCCPRGGPLVRILHSDGRQETSERGKEVSEELLKHWKSLPTINKSIANMTFPELRTLGTKVLAHFCAPPGAKLKLSREQEPTFWRVPVSVDHLPR